MQFWRQALTLAVVGSLVLPGCASTLPVSGRSNGNNGIGDGHLGYAGRSSWIDPHAKKDKLLYVSESTGDSNGGIDIFTFQRPRLVGRISTDAYGLCSDKSGNVWAAEVTPSTSEMVEYAHGETAPTAELKVPNPYSCSVDPSSGDLAVTVRGAAFWIFTHGSGSGREFGDPGVEGFVYCAYDDKGNLYLQGLYGYAQLAFAKLSRGHNRAAGISFSGLPDSGSPGGLQWYGSNLAVGIAGTPIVYQIKTTRKGGNLAGQTQLEGSYGLKQFSVADGKILVSGTNAKGVANFAVWDYPDGGIRDVQRNLDDSLGVAISVP